MKKAGTGYGKSYNQQTKKLQPSSWGALAVTTSYIGDDHELRICWKRHHGVLQPVMAEASTGDGKAAMATGGESTTGDRKCYNRHGGSCDRRHEKLQPAAKNVATGDLGG
jgi:hypothetical protein